MMRQLLPSRPTDPIYGLIVSIAMLIFGGEAAHAQSSAPVIAKGDGTIVEVVDGDTARVKMPGGHAVEVAKVAAQKAQVRYQRYFDLERIYDDSRNQFNPTMLVRVANIDTAESVHPDTQQNTREGAKASSYADAHFSGRSARVTCYDIGYYGRPICDINTTNGDWAAQMIKAGFSEYVTEYGRHPDPLRHRKLQEAHNNVFSE